VLKTAIKATDVIVKNIEAIKLDQKINDVTQVGLTSGNQIKKRLKAQDLLAFQKRKGPISGIHPKRAHRKFNPPRMNITSRAFLISYTTKAAIHKDKVKTT
jgi:hypothetical protein